MQLQLDRVFGTQYMTEVLIYGSLEGKNINVIKMIRLLLFGNITNKEKLSLFLKNKVDIPNYSDLKDSIVYYQDNRNNLGVSKLIGDIDGYYVGVKKNGYESTLFNKNAWLKADTNMIKKYY